MLDGEDLRDCHYRCARPTLNGSFGACLMASLSIRLSKKRSDPDLFRAACDIGLEGLVSKRSDRAYRGGRSKDWIKVKNRQHHAFERVRETFDGKTRP
jgi:ATP-dependent DNA ligase